VDRESIQYLLQHYHEMEEEIFNMIKEWNRAVFGLGFMESWYGMMKERLR